MARVHLKVFVLPDGSVVARQMDMLLPALNAPTIVRRVTTIDWNEACRYWQVKTLTGLVLFTSLRRDACLAYEANMVDRVMAQFFMCRNMDGRMRCPDCHTFLGREIYAHCPACGFGFPTGGVVDGLTWSDFSLLERMCYGTN